MYWKLDYFLKSSKVKIKNFELELEWREFVGIVEGEVFIFIAVNRWELL